MSVALLVSPGTSTGGPDRGDSAGAGEAFGSRFVAEAGAMTLASGDPGGATPRAAGVGVAGAPELAAQAPTNDAARTRVAVAAVHRQTSFSHTALSLSPMSVVIIGCFSRSPNGVVLPARHRARCELLRRHIAKPGEGRRRHGMTWTNT